jgi:D-alanyl-D-alanine dipeptidase
MLRFIQVIILLSVVAHSSTQIILVISEDFNATRGTLHTFEKKTEVFEPVLPPFDINLGRHGLGWGEGILTLKHQRSEPIKHEGDGRAPSGIFALGNAFGYAKSISSKLHYTQATEDLICVDDVNDSHYNQLLHVSDKSSIKSYEDMLRNDNLYEIGLIVKHNEKNIPKKGSCIFLHVQKDINAPTSGCTSMSKDHLSQLLHWLDPQKEPLLIQIPKIYYRQILEHFPALPKSL